MLVYIGKPKVTLWSIIKLMLSNIIKLPHKAKKK